jgi:hypothetical protein
MNAWHGTFYCWETSMKPTHLSKILGPAFSLSDPWELKCLTTLVRVDFPDVPRDQVHEVVTEAVKSSKKTFSRKHILESARASLRT